jgi:hypothetical protein
LARINVLKALKIGLAVVWALVLYSLVEAYQRLRVATVFIMNTDNEQDSMILKKVGTFLSEGTVSQLGRQKSSFLNPFLLKFDDKN